MNTSPSPPPHIDLIPLDMIDDLPDHPFKVRISSQMPYKRVLIRPCEERNPFFIASR